MEVFNRACHNTCEYLVRDYLSKIRYGNIELKTPTSTQIYGPQDGKQPKVVIDVKNPEFFKKAIFRQDIGLGESYMEQMWECNDLVLLIEVLLQNLRYSVKPVSSYMDHVASAVGGVVTWIWTNNPLVSHSNVAHHYDLGNDFYEFMLDRATMSYTCAVYNSPTDSLEQAQYNKLHLVINKAELKPTDHVLELGCGWGGFAIEAAKRIGCRMTSVNLSAEQVKYARERARKEGVDHLIEFKQMDYRHVDVDSVKYDKVVSIGMMEHVGHFDYPTFFALADKAMKPDGILVVHTITSLDQKYEKYRKYNDFIREYIFPGSNLPSPTALINAAVESSTFTIQHLENFGPNYARTLHDWRQNFQENIDQIRALGPQYDEKFLRMWDFYLTYCEGAFKMNHIGLHQFVFRRPTKDSPFPLGRNIYSTTLGERI